MRALARERPERLDEADLMRRLTEGDLSALGTIYDRYAEDVRLFVVRATGRRDVADDVTHDAFVALVEASKRYDPEHAVRAFVIGIAGKLVLRRRRRAAVAFRVLGELRDRLVTRHDRTPEVEADEDQQLERYRRALARLSDAKRLTVVMADLEGLTGPEIARALDLPVGTVWTRLHHARRALRDAVLGGET